MINKNELRLGNTTLFCRQPVVIDRIDEHGATNYVFNEEKFAEFMHWHELDGLPLTRDILTQSKFKLDGGGSFCLEFHLLSGRKAFRLWLLNDIIQWNPCEDEMIPLKYVHELQNLFYALYREELDIYP